MGKKGKNPRRTPPAASPAPAGRPPSARPSALLDTRVIDCGDNLEQLAKPALSLSNGLPDRCIDLSRGDIDPAPVSEVEPPFNSNRNRELSGEVFWGETKEKRSFEDRHASTQAYIDYMRPRCVELARVLKKTGRFYYHCDWHAVTGMVDIRFANELGYWHDHATVREQLSMPGGVHGRVRFVRRAVWAQRGG